MDAQRNFPEEQEPGWYAGEPGYAESDWRPPVPGQPDPGPEQRQPEPTQRPAEPDRYAEPGRRRADPDERYAEPEQRRPEGGRFAAADPLGAGFDGDRFPGDPYGESPSRWDEASHASVGVPLPRFETEPRPAAAPDPWSAGIGRLPADPAEGSSVVGSSTVGSSVVGGLVVGGSVVGGSVVGGSVVGGSAVGSPAASAVGNPQLSPVLGGYPIVETGRSPDQPRPLELPTGALAPVGPRAEADPAGEGAPRPYPERFGPGPHAAGRSGTDGSYPSAASAGENSVPDGAFVPTETVSDGGTYGRDGISMSGSMYSSSRPSGYGGAYQSGQPPVPGATYPGGGAHQSGPASHPPLVESQVPGTRGRDRVYRTRRPALAVLLAALTVIFELPALRLLASAAAHSPVPAGGVVAGTLLVLGLPTLAIGLYSLSTGAVSLSEPGRVWLRPPTAYLAVGLVLLVAAGLAAG